MVSLGSTAYAHVDTNFVVTSTNTSVAKTASELQLLTTCEMFAHNEDGSNRNVYTSCKAFWLVRMLQPWYKYRLPKVTIVSEYKI